MSDKNYMAKIAVLNDAHLSAVNIGYSRDYSLHCLAQLDSFIDYVEANEITHVILAGDFWDTASVPDKFKGQVFIRLRRLRSICNVYATRGNHESSTKNLYTVYDLTLDAGLIDCVSELNFNDIQLRLFDYADQPESLKIENADELLSEGKHIIGIYHNNIVESEILDLPVGILIEPSKTDIFHGVELGLVAHIHTPMGLFTSTDNTGFTTRWYIAGSHGRDQYKKGQIRDNYILQIITIDSDGRDYEFSMPTLPLVPVSEFFDVARALEEKRKQIDMENFTEGMKDVTIDFVDAADEISKLDNVDSDVKNVCYELLDRTPSVTVKKSVKLNLDASQFAETSEEEELFKMLEWSGYKCK